MQTVLWVNQRQEACPDLVRCWCPEAPLESLRCWEVCLEDFPDVPKAGCLHTRAVEKTSSLSGALGWPVLALFALQDLLVDDIKFSMLACSMQISSHFCGVGSAAVAALLLHAGLWTLGLPSTEWQFSESCEKSYMPTGFVEIM